MAEKSLSPARYLAWSSLISAMHRATQETRGLKIRVDESQVPLLKRAFYQIKASEQGLENLSLLATSDPACFLIYHPPAKEEIPNG